MFDGKEEKIMGELAKHAKRELELIKKDDDGIQEILNKDILELIESFEKQNHSGFSGSYVIRILNRLLEFKTLTPLTGEPDEWNTINEYIKQNKRYSSVFLKYGVPMDIDAIIVSDDGGLTWYHSTQFRKTIYFPYTPPEEPEKIYIEWLDDDHYDIITDDSERIEKLRKRKEKEKI